MADIAADSAPPRGEVAALVAIQSALGERPGALAAAWALSHFGEHSIGWLAVSAIGALLQPARRRAWLVAGAGAFTAHAAAVLIKRLVRRPRPHHPAVAVNVGTPSSLSFPSAPATSTTAAAILLARVTGLPLPGMLVPPMALSRVLLGVHYPSDVATGVAVGAAVAAATEWAAARVDRRWPGYWPARRRCGPGSGPRRSRAIGRRQVERKDEQRGRRRRQEGSRTAGQPDCRRGQGDAPAAMGEKHPGGGGTVGRVGHRRSPRLDQGTGQSGGRLRGVLPGGLVHLLSKRRPRRRGRPPTPDQAVPPDRRRHRARVAGLHAGGGARGDLADHRVGGQPKSGAGDGRVHRHAAGLLLRAQTPSGH